VEKRNRTLESRAAITTNSPPEVCCREIGADDLDSIADLLTAGFPKPRNHWVRALKLLSVRVVPDGFPRYGYVLETPTAAVGVILLIFSRAPNSGMVRCNGFAWYVAPTFRTFASLLLLKILRHRVTHTNVSPSRHTLPTIEALGYKRFCSGVFAAIPVLAAGIGGTKIRRVVAALHPERFVPAADLQVLRDHESFGCFSLWCETRDKGYPLIFRRRFIKHLPLVPTAQLVYCTSLDDLVCLAGPVGKYLALRGIPLMLIPANGPIPKLVGRFFDGKPMYYFGPEQPRLGDLAYTEVAMFGF
jgi:hypothetical protein